MTKFDTDKPEGDVGSKLEPGSHAVDARGMELACGDHRGSEYASDDLLDALLSMERLYDELGDPVRGGRAFELSADDAKLRLDEGFHLLDASKVVWHKEGLQKHMGGLVKMFGRSDPDRAGLLDQLSGQIDSGTFDPLPWLSEQAPFDKGAAQGRAEKLGLAEDMVLFLGDHLARPALISCAQRLSRFVEADKWLRGYCPICGNKPGLGALNPEEGLRVLRCSRCRFVWAFQRVLCPNCGNDDHKKLRYFSVERHSEYRIDACDECRTYVKTLDYRKAPKDRLWFPEVEDAATLYLDLMARREGYERL